MKFFRKYSEVILLILLSVSVFYITISFDFAPDTYYDIKAGEVFTQQGIIFHDVFSNSAYGQMWYPQEWLAQIVFYDLDHFFGMNSIALFVSFFSVLQIFLIYYYVKKLFNVPNYLSAIISLVYTVGVAFYMIARPNLFANFCFIVTTFLILFYLLKNKNYLWLLIPFALFWVNVHASFIFLLFLLGSYTALSVGQYFLSKEKVWLHKAKVLGLYTLGIFILTVTPPLYGISYQLLWLFFKYGKLISQSFEWEPLSGFTMLFYSYTLVLVVLGVFGYVIRKKITHRDILFAIPFAIIAFTPYLAFRNLLFGWFGIIIFMAYTIEKLRTLKRFKLLIGIYLGIIIVLLAFYNTFIPFYRKVNTTRNPTEAVSFILNHHLQGNMFNSMDYGMYLLYALYPQQKDFVDGRLEVFFCCALADLNKLDLVMASHPSQYPSALYSLLDRHHISFVLLTRDATDIPILQVMSQNPQWSLVYWDDSAEIFVRRKDQNDDIIARYGAIAAQPYSTVLYDHQHVQQAIDEYNRMIGISDSAKSRNILGLIYLRQGDVQTATEEFNKAVQADSTYPPPYVNLAYIAYTKGDYNQAISDYQLAIQNKSIDAVPYITLGELYIKLNNDTGKAKDVWQQGLSIVTDPAGRARLTELLNSY